MTLQAYKSGGYREIWSLAGPLILGMMSLTLMEFCDRVIDNSFMTIRHGAKLAGGARSGGGNSNKGSGRRAVEEEDGDGDSEGKSEKPRAGAKASMEAEFEE